MLRRRIARACRAQTILAPEKAAVFRIAAI
jgi:hypothetical protein